MRSTTARILIAINILTLIAPAHLCAQTLDGMQSYRLGAGDVLQLNVLQQPTLDRSVLVRPDGTAIIPPVGEIMMAGLTVSEAEELVRSKLRLFHRDVVDVSLTVTEYHSLQVYVLGAVGNPGSFTFDHPPTLWDAIRNAGGTSADAILSRVRVISRDAQGFHSVNYDLTPLITGQGDTPIVLLSSGQTVMVPAAGDESLASASPENGIQVFGGVASPGTYAVGEPTNLMTVLMLAGGPIEQSKLDEIQWVHRRGAANFSSDRVNLELFLQEGEVQGNPMIHPGDTVQVPRIRPGFFRTVYPIILGTITTAASVIFVVDRIQD